MTSETKIEAQRLLAYLLVSMGVTSMAAVTPDMRAKIAMLCRMVEPGGTQAEAVTEDQPLFSEDTMILSSDATMAVAVGALLGLENPPAPAWVVVGGFAWDKFYGRGGSNREIIDITADGFVRLDGAPAALPMGWFLDAYHQPDPDLRKTGLPCPTCGVQFPTQRGCDTCNKAEKERAVAVLVEQMHANAPMAR